MTAGKPRMWIGGEEIPVESVSLVRNCSAWSPSGFMCTLVQHEGDHVAAGRGGEVYDTWPNTDPDRYLFGKGWMPVTASINFTNVNPGLYDYMLGTSGARDDLDRHLVGVGWLACEPGTAAYGRQRGLTLYTGDIYYPASDRERRFAEAQLEWRGLKLQPWAGGAAYIVEQTPNQETP